ncbi:hypothetical protein [Streptomyces anulatus]|uniref:hypothetical protein n=1 Tax=Streptomyces anulatus TaxID=1892 RepID=UPI00343A77B8
MSAERDHPVRLHVTFAGGVYRHDTVLPADWVRQCGHDDLDDYVRDELLPEALTAGGLACVLEPLFDE